MFMDLRFIHAADLHLGSPIPAGSGAAPFVKEQLENSIYRAVENMIHDAASFQVDFLLIAGDLFDQENRSLKQQLFLKKQFETLHKYSIPVYLIYGNHDPVHRKFAPVEWPDNVHIFHTTPEVKVFTKNNKEAAYLYGCSYEERELRNVAREFKKKDGSVYHIGLLHGQEKQGRDHPYAPFERRELEEKQFDYWALGHIHARQYISDRISYPGNIQGRHRKETGEKGYSLVEIKGGELQVTFRAAADVLFYTLELPIEDCLTFNNLTNALLQQISILQSQTSGGLMLDVTLTGKGDLSDFLHDDSEKEMWKETVNEMGAAERPFFYVYRMENHTVSEELPNHAEEEHFLSDMLKAAEKLKHEPGKVEKEWQDLYHHPSAGKYLSSVTEENADSMIQEAERMLWQMWGKEKANED